VIEDEVARRVQFDTLYEQRVAQARYAAEDSERRYRHVDPANRLVASQLERHWEDSLTELNAANDQLQQFRNSSPTQVNEDERSKLRNACADIQQLWKTKATLIERKKIARLLLRQVDVDVQDNSERVHVRLHWAGGYESVYEITRVIQQFCQLDNYQSLVNRALTLMLSGKSAPQVACILEREGYRCPRHLKPLSASMIKKMLASNPIAHKQLTAPELSANQWLASSLASTLGIPEKRLKDWVTRGWATAIQRPHGRAWVLYADQQEIDRLLALVRCQTGQGRPLPPKALRTPRLISRDNQ
jgi:hypothetical protein